MAETVTKIKYFSISDFKEEEVWLRERSREGLHLLSVKSFVYKFEKGEPEDMIYRLDFTDNAAGDDYFRMLGEYGWQSCGKTVGWNYWRRPAAQIANEAEGELFSDDESRLEMVKNVWSKRMLPIFAIFLCTVVPQFSNAMAGIYGEARTFFRVFYSVLMVLYMYLIVHCGVKLGRMQRELEREK